MGACISKVDTNKDGKLSSEEIAIAVVHGLRAAGALAEHANKAADLIEKAEV